MHQASAASGEYVPWRRRGHGACRAAAALPGGGPARGRDSRPHWSWPMTSRAPSGGAATAAWPAIQRRVLTRARPTAFRLA